MKMRIIAFVGLCAALTGCLTKAPTLETTAWLLDAAETKPAVAAPKYGTARISQISVRAPYDARQMVVMRKDGTVAFDAYNLYAALPSALLKGTVEDALKASGAFRSVLPAHSAAACDCSVEVAVTRLALDARNAGDLRATAGVSLALTGRLGVVLGVSAATVDVPVRDGGYGVALSRAVTDALVKAAAGL